MTIQTYVMLIEYQMGFVGLAFLILEFLTAIYAVILFGIKADYNKAD